MSDPAMTAIVTLLERELGLDVASVGTRAIDAALGRRLTALKQDLGRYATTLAGSRTEFDALIDELVVPETWFFRDVAPFRLLAARATSFLASQPLRPFRVLSIPCASGEEPYSIAITLLEVGLRPQQFVINAFDISARNIEQAKCGRYGKGSFRGQPPFPVAKYLEGEPGKQTVMAKVRATVRFAQRNVLDEGFLADEPRFDVIMCRNLLIYLTPAARSQLVAVIDRSLHDDGVVIVGHAEALDRIEPRFRPTDDSGAFAYRRGVAPPITRPIPIWVPPSPPPPLRARSPVIEYDDARDTGAQTAITTAPTPPSAATLEAATALANRGEVEAALAMCDQLIASHAPHAGHYTLLGLVQQSRNNIVAAERAFTQALYIDPRHHDALVHLALLLRQRGQTAAADQLMKRAERARGIK